MSQIHQPRTDRPIGKIEPIGKIGPIGIIGATRLEIGLFKKKMKRIERERVGNSRFFRGHFSGREIVLVQSGIGYYHASNACSHMIERFSPFVIVSIGLAGSVDMATKVGDILLAPHLLWVRDTEELKVEKTYTLDESLINITSNILAKYDLEFTLGKVLTVPSFIFTLEERYRIGQELKVKAVEMEGAAIAGEAIKHRVPLLVLRMISDDMSTREIDFGMVLGTMGKATLRGAVRFFLVHRRDLLEVFRFGRQLRRLGKSLSGIGARIVEELTPLSIDPMRERDLPVLRKKIPGNHLHSNGREIEVS
jgi:adenosylhomocysteine nucleosidase